MKIRHLIDTELSQASKDRRFDDGQFGTCGLSPNEEHRLKIIKGITFRDESILLDGRHFIDCNFTDCTLEYGGGSVILERTAIHSCKHMLFGYARQTAKYMRTVGLCDDPLADQWAEYAGPVN